MKPQVQYPSLQSIEFIMDWMFGWNCITIWFPMSIVYLTYIFKVDAIPITHQKYTSQNLIGAISISDHYKNWNYNIVWVWDGYWTSDLFLKIDVISITNQFFLEIVALFSLRCVIHIWFIFQSECYVHHKLWLRQYPSQIGNKLKLYLHLLPVLSYHF